MHDTTYIYLERNQNFLTELKHVINLSSIVVHIFISTRMCGVQFLRWTWLVVVVWELSQNYKDSREIYELSDAIVPAIWIVAIRKNDFLNLFQLLGFTCLHVTHVIDILITTFILIIIFVMYKKFDAEPFAHISIFISLENIAMFTLWFLSDFCPSVLSMIYC